jgi:Protein of unknown function (DUF1194)
MIGRDDAFLALTAAGRMLLPPAAAWHAANVDVAGTVVSGLAMINDPVSGIFAEVQPPGALPDYDRHNATGGPSRFVLEVYDFHSFGDATRRKLITELIPKRYPALP